MSNDDSTDGAPTKMVKAEKPVKKLHSNAEKRYPAQVATMEGKIHSPNK